MTHLTVLTTEVWPLMAIPTKYRGVEYRSRLEAKWAGFFHRLGWQFTYEPFDGNGYIPDFLIHGPDPFLVEVKPAVTREDYFAAVPKAERGLSGLWDHDILIVGVSPIAHSLETCWDDTPLGLLGEGGPQGWLWEAGLFTHHCYGGDGPRGGRRKDNPDSPCGASGVWHAVNSYHARPCGHSSGGRPPGSLAGGADVIEDAWAGATNDVKWRAK